MALPELQKLYQELLNTEFNFISKGEVELTEIYNKVRTKYSALCDDNYLCSENCSRGNNQPEWQHTVRKALDRLKNTSNKIKKGSMRGFWILS